MAIGMRMRPLAVENRPEGFTKCDYLEGTGKQGAFVTTPIDKLSMLGRFSLATWNATLYKVFGVWYEEDSIYQMVRRTEPNLEMRIRDGIASNLPQTEELLVKVDYIERKAYLNGSVILDGFTMPATSDTVRFGILCDGGTAWQNYVSHFAYARFHRLKLWDEKVLTYDLVPALDPSGRPCMFDLVSRMPFYNQNTTGPDFLYKTYSYPFNPGNNWHTVNKKIKEIVGSTKYTLELIEDGE